MVLQIRDRPREKTKYLRCSFFGLNEPADATGRSSRQPSWSTSAADQSQLHADGGGSIAENYADVTYGWPI